MKALSPAKFADERFGVPTVTDIIRELDKPGRDPRPEFKTATFADGIEKVSDLKVGMKLEGTVTNVTAFGAFVDIGVHQDGLDRRLPAQAFQGGGIGVAHPDVVIARAGQEMGDHAPDLVVIACNTVSAVAPERLRVELDLPVIGVIEPGARAAAEAVISALDT